MFIYKIKERSLNLSFKIVVGAFTALGHLRGPADITAIY